MAIRPSRHKYTDGFVKPPAPAVYRRIAYTFFGVTILVVIGALWISSVRARVIVTVRKDTTAIQSTVNIAKSPEQGQLPGRVLEGTFEKIQEFSVRAASDTAQTPVVVHGTVKIINNYSQPQTLVATTRLLTPDGRLYRIDKTVTLKPKESILVAAHSDQKGAKYVLSKGVHLSIPGLWSALQKWIYAEPVSGFTGGSESGKIVSSLDVTDARRVLEDAVFEQARKTLTSEAGLGNGYTAIFSKKVIDSKTNVIPGDKSDQFLASVKLDITAVFYPKSDMEALVRQKLKEGLPQGRDLVNFEPSQMTIKILTADTQLEKASLSLSAQASSRLTKNSPALSKSAIAGMSISDVKSKLKAIDGVEKVTIQIQPAWIGKLPAAKDHIDLIIK